LDTSNIGNQMLQRMGWKEGSGLGKSRSGITAPISVRFACWVFGLITLEVIEPLQEYIIPMLGYVVIRYTLIMVAQTGLSVVIKGPCLFFEAELMLCAITVA